jgi:hypothetical protein
VNGERGCCCAWGAGERPAGRPDRGRGALGSVTVPCFKGAWGFRQCAGRGTVSKRHCSVSFFFYIYFFNFIFILFMGYPKMGYNRCPLFIILTEQGFCAVSFIKINKTDLVKA